MRANTKQQEILEENCWTKKLSTLLNHQQHELKESISVEEANTIIRELRLERLGQCGREVGRSLIPGE
jgi:hypothetical protein